MISKTLNKVFYGADPSESLYGGRVSISSAILSIKTKNADMLGKYTFDQNTNFLDEDIITMNFDRRGMLNTEGNIFSLFEHEYQFHGRMNLRGGFWKPTIHDKVYNLKLIGRLLNLHQAIINRTSLIIINFLIG